MILWNVKIRIKVKPVTTSTSVVPESQWLQYWVTAECAEIKEQSLLYVYGLFQVLMTSQ